MMKRDDILLKITEAKKLNVMELLVDGRITAARAAERLHISVRQEFRLKAKFEAKGDYHAASLNHISELIKERDNVCVSAKTFGNILKEAGVNNIHTHKGVRKRRTRERKPREGELVQIYASPFDWLGTGQLCNLHGAIDDATGKVLGGHFEPTECKISNWIFLKNRYQTRHSKVKGMPDRQMFSLIIPGLKILDKLHKSGIIIVQDFEKHHTI